MIRRNVLQTERDRRVVKWWLIAAAAALSLGSYARVELAHDEEPADATAVIHEAPEAPAPPAVPVISG